MRTAYSYSLAVTSQFYYCGLPLRLDSFSRCTYDCLYCFANARGGYRGSTTLATADPNSLRRRMERLQGEPPRSVVDELLAKRQPIHFGGISDPFLPAEAQVGVSLRLLNVLADYGHPTVISTKSNLIGTDEYLDVLTRGRFIVQVSMSAVDDRLIEKTDVGTSGPSALLKALGALRSEGIATACRIQPLLPGYEDAAFEVIDACAAVGVRHVAVEHLKLPIERSWRGTARLSAALGVDLHEYFAWRAAYRVGREWILPVDHRLARVVELRRHAHKCGVTFGAADNDLLLLSDGDCCCSGVDLIPGFGHFFRFNHTEAARRGIGGNRISIDHLRDVWCPEGSIAQYVNSRSRLPTRGCVGRGIRDYVRQSWNGSPNGFSPAALCGAEHHGEYDEAGFKIYTLSEAMRELAAERQTNPAWIGTAAGDRVPVASASPSA